MPGINCKDNTVTFEAASYQEAYDGIVVLIRIAGRGWGFQSLLREVIRKHEDVQKIYKDYVDLLYQRGADVENGKWPPPKPPKKEKPSKKKYFGAQ